MKAIMMILCRTMSLAKQQAIWNSLLAKKLIPKEEPGNGEADPGEQHDLEEPRESLTEILEKFEGI